MKNKIENLIKEVGINEVESILQEMKSKSKVNVNVKQELKKDFFELLRGCTISLVRNDIECRKNDKLLFYYNKNKNYIFLIFEIWSNFESKYNLNYQELSDLLLSLVEEVLNYKGVTLKENYWRLYHRWKN